MKTERARRSALLRVPRGLFLFAVALLPVPTAAQAPVSLMSVRVAYTTQKAKLNPQGALAATLAGVEREFAEALRLGKTSEARRLLAKGMALVAGTPWTPELEYARSLVLRTDHVVTDSSKPFVVRLEQIYSPSIELPAGLGARVDLLATGRAAPAGPGGEPVLARGFEVPPVPRDLLDAPLSFELDLKGLADGVYRLALTVTATPRQPNLRGEKESLGTAALTIAVVNGLEERLARLSAAAQSLPESRQADVLSPVDFVKNVNLARIPLGNANVGSALSNAEALLAVAKTGKDPFAGRTGDFTRHYFFKAAGEILPYRMYVPTSYDGTKRAPLIVALHGLGGTEASFFEAYDRRLPALAEKHGYIVVAPLGYRPDGFYGWGVGEPPADPAARQLQERSEQDVMDVLARVQRDYRIDGSRIYLIGHSMGAIGTWRLAAKYPDIWAALGPISGTGTPSTVERMKAIPQIVVHGDEDPTVPVNASRLMVAEMKRLGVDVQYIEVPGGNHGSVVAPNLEAVVSFFDGHVKK